MIDAIEGHLVGDYLLQDDWMAKEKKMKKAISIYEKLTIDWLTNLVEWNRIIQDKSKNLTEFERATKTFDLAWEAMDTHLYESIRANRVLHDRAIKIMGEFQTRLLEEKEKGLSEQA